MSTVPGHRRSRPHRRASVAVVVGAALICPLLLTSPAAAQGRYVVPRRSAEIAASPWGIQAGDNERADLFERAADIGVKWTRLTASWPGMERERGRYGFERLDRAVDNARAQGITPFVSIAGGNGLYSPPIPHPDPNWRLIYGVKPGPPVNSDEAMQAWLAFVEATVRHASPRVTHWEVWNEPNHYGYWGGPPDAAAYGRLVRLTAGRIKRVDPKAIVIAGSLAGLDAKFVAGFLAEDTARAVDVVSFHHYALLPEARIYAADETWKAMRAHNPKLVLWQGECGYPSHSSTKDFRGGSPWGPMVQAKWLLRQAFVDTYFMRAQLSNYFKLWDTGNRADRQQRPEPAPVDLFLGFPAHPEGRRVRGVGVNEKTLLSVPSMEPKPAYFAYRHLTAIADARYQPIDVDGRSAIRVTAQGQFAGIGEADDAYPSVPLLAAYKTAGGAPLVAYWLPWQPQEYTPEPARITLRLPGIRFKAPVAVNLLSGEVLRLDGSKDEAGTTVIEGLPLFDFPVVIAEQDEVTTDDRRRVPAYPALPSVTKTPNPERFAGQIQAYLERDQTNPPPQDAILFVGSSIFRQWSSLEAQMAPLPVFNRAFGGSRTGEILHYMDRIVLPYQPRIIVYYCGSNDVNGGEPADVIAGRAQLFAQRVGAALPKTTVYFVSVNRAPQKRDRWDVVDGVNRAMREYAERASNLKYIDVNTALFDEAGNPRMEMYVADRLHLTPPAYEAFSAIIKPILADAWEKRDVR